MSKQSRGVSTAPKQSDGDRSPSLSSSNSSNGWFDLDKRHCCCCVRLPEGAVLVGLYGLSVHAGLLVTQVAHGRADWLWAPAVIQWEEEGGRTGEGGGRGGLVEVVGAITIVGHVVGILVNAMLVFGTCTSRRVFMLPWLVAQGFLAAAFAALALYYVSFFPQSECLRQEGPKSRLPRVLTPKNTRLPDWSPPEVACRALLWHAAVLVLAVVALFYYFYIVHELMEQLRLEAKVRSDLELATTLAIEEKKKKKQASPAGGSGEVGAAGVPLPAPAPAPATTADDFGYQEIHPHSRQPEEAESRQGGGPGYSNVPASGAGGGGGGLLVVATEGSREEGEERPDSPPPVAPRRAKQPSPPEEGTAGPLVTAPKPNTRTPPPEERPPPPRAGEGQQPPSPVKKEARRVRIMEPS